MDKGIAVRKEKQGPLEQAHCALGTGNHDLGRDGESEAPVRIGKRGANTGPDFLRESLNHRAILFRKGL